MTITRTAKYSKKLVIRSGDLKHYILIQERTLKSPISDSVDFTNDFVDKGYAWASVKIANKIDQFAKVNIAEDITHIFYIRYETFDTLEINVGDGVLFSSIRYRIMSLSDIDFEKNFLALNCILKGDSSKESSKW